MRIRTFLLTILTPAVFLAGGCGTVSKSTPSQDASTASQNSTANNSLTARNLERGECGLFVWSADQDRRFILFSQSQKSKAVWAGPSGEDKLRITQKSGQVFQEQYTEQTFAPQNLTLTLKNDESLIDSTRFKGGTLSQIQADGLERISPIAALSICR